VTPPPLAQRIALGLMHATQVATPFHRQGWVYEEKVDGYRMVTYKEGRTVRLISRQGKEFTQRFPALANVAELGVESVILDTEVAVFDRQLISRFEWLRGRPEGDAATPPMLMAFDLLELDGEDQRKRPQRERRQALEHLLKGERVILPVRRLTPGAWRRGRTCCERAMKGWWRRIRSRHVGGRTLRWLKVKQQKYREGERGWEPKR
jgi:bifunctional non-homologous end joining protein LigD